MIFFFFTINVYEVVVFFFFRLSHFFQFSSHRNLVRLKAKVNVIANQIKANCAEIDT